MMLGMSLMAGCRGRRCHSSSVTKGMSGCSSRSPLSRHVHSVARVSRLAVAFSGCGKGDSQIPI